MAHAAHDPAPHGSNDDAHGHVTADGDDLPHHGVVLEEPKSPMWLPLVGLALFGLLLVWWLSTPNEQEERAAAAQAASASASASASAAPAQAPAADDHAGHGH